jgi:hypothetical protein
MPDAPDGNLVVPSGGRPAEEGFACTAAILAVASLVARFVSEFEVRELVPAAETSRDHVIDGHLLGCVQRRGRVDWRAADPADEAVAVDQAAQLRPVLI